MKKWSILSAAILFSVALTGCTSAYYAASGYAGDDLYVTHDKAEIARRQQREAEVRKAEADARRAEWEARLAEAQAAAAETNYKRAATGSSSNSYTSVLADSYESAYARRLYGFESLSYRMPSSYWNFRYGDAFTYVSAYDPAFYNIVISGDQVWVEPKYITSMFGTWGATVYTGSWYGSWGWNLAWSHTPRWWGYSPWGWSSWGYAYHPWHASWYGPGWGYGWRPGWSGHWAYRPAHNYRLDRYPSRPSNTGYRNSTPAGSRTNGTGGVNSGRRGGYNNSGTGSYNNRGNRSNGTSRSTGGNSSYNNSNSNSNRGNYNYNSGSSGRSSGGSGSSGGTRSSGGGGGGRSYTGGR